VRSGGGRSEEEEGEGGELELDEEMDPDV